MSSKQHQKQKQKQSKKKIKTNETESINLVSSSDDDLSPSKVRKTHHNSSLSSNIGSSNLSISVNIPPRLSEDDVNNPENRENRDNFLTRLANIPGPPVKLINDIDDTSPSPAFQFISEHVLRPGTKRLAKEFHSGCECRPDNGRKIGCEYLKCMCLDETAKSPEGKSLGFPYYAVPGKKGCLREIYLETRYAIYECNELCTCPPDCKNKVVQLGRQVPLEIFKTENRGWGLRCPVSLKKGEFIDTYRGEVITDAEATRRESATGKGKDSYLYTLDKFQGEPGDEDYIADKDLYVVDGEFMGGPTRFMNHSCEPNCRQFTVSTVRGDYYVYELPFFALRDIPAGTELTFNYTDNEDDEPVREKDVLKMARAKGKEATRCLCGAEDCKKFLWL